MRVVAPTAQCPRSSPVNTAAATCATSPPLRAGRPRCWVSARPPSSVTACADSHARRCASELALARVLRRPVDLGNGPLGGRLQRYLACGGVVAPEEPGRTRAGQLRYRTG